MRRRSVVLAVVAGLVFVVTSLGIAAPATRGAQVSGDEPQYLLTALSLWEDQNLDISDEIAAESYRVFHRVDLDPQTRPLEDGRQISPHDPLLPLLLAIPMGLGGWVGAKTAMALIAGVLAASVTAVAIRVFGVRQMPAALLVVLFFLSPPLAVYATQIYPEIPAALAVVAAVAALTKSRPWMTRGGTWATAAAVVALPWLGVKYIPVAAVLAVFGVIRSQPERRTALLGWLALAGLLYVAGHLWLYGGLTPYGTGDFFVAGEWTAVGTSPNLVGRSTRLLGLLVDREFGLVPWQPLYLLAVPALAWTLRRPTPAGRLMVALGTTGWLVATFVALTMQGWWFPGRQVVVILPAVVLVVIGWASADRRRLLTASLLGALGVVAFLFLVVEGRGGTITWIVDFASTTDPFYRALAWISPDYQNPSPLTWALHAGWLIVVGLILVSALRGARSTSFPTPDREVERRKEILR